MDSRVQHFFESLQGKKVTFIGAGVSHAELIKLFAKKGAKVTLCDKREANQLGELAAEFTALSVELRLGEKYLARLSDADIIFRTPGMRFYTEELNRARESGCVVTSEMEVFFDLCPCPIFAVTGSDGKTTTTSIIANMFERAGKTVFLGGNIGRALLPLIEEIGPGNVAVVELSSFQLISMRTSPNVAVVTNLAPNHLDMHKDMQEYIDAKKNIFLHQNAFSRTVLNRDNEITQGFGSLVRGELFEFSRRTPVARGAFLSDDGYLYFADKNGLHKLFSAEEIRIPGAHNIENYLAAVSAVYGYVSEQIMQETAREFPGVEHRIEFVREVGGVRYYNDSIATSPTRTIAGLQAFSQKVVLIAGGYDKKIPFLPLAPKVIEKVKTLILTGDTADKIADVVTGMQGYNEKSLPILRAQSMEEAVQLAKDAAQPGDIVTLSPACASFDRYPNFEARGIHFKQIVQAL